MRLADEAASVAAGAGSAITRVTTATATKGASRVIDTEPRPARSALPVSGRVRRCAAGLLLLVALVASGSARATAQATYRIDHVTDGDTVVLRNGQKVRLVQVDTPEVFFGTECYGPQASATTKRLLPVGTRVRLLTEPATDRVDDFGRLLRYVVRVRDGVNVNIRLVAVGAAAPYFYAGRRGQYAARLERLAKHARAAHLGLVGCLPAHRVRPVPWSRDATMTWQRDGLLR